MDYEKAATAIADCAERLTQATEALSGVLSRLEAGQEALSAKIDRIIAAIEDREVSPSDKESDSTNTGQGEGAVQASARKTLSPLATMLLAKSGVDEGQSALGGELLDKALATLSVEQRIAVKSEMARAGLLQ